MAKSVSSKSKKEPQVTRIEGNTTLVVPRGHYASVLLKLVGHCGKNRYYAWWAMVGRHDVEVTRLKYKYTGEDTIRIDLPNGTTLSRAVMQTQLRRFLNQQGELEDKPPIIIQDIKLEDAPSKKKP